MDRTGDWSQSAPLALDASGWPHISYYDSTNQDLKYAHFGAAVGDGAAISDGASWQLSTVDPGSACYDYDTSLALDGADRPHIGYSCFPNESYYPGDLRYAYFDGTAWLTETVDSGGVGPTAVYSWPATGTNVCGGEVVDRLPVRVLAEWPYYLYLPLVQRP